MLTGIFRDFLYKSGLTFLFVAMYLYISFYLLYLYLTHHSLEKVVFFFFLKNNLEHFAFFTITSERMFIKVVMW